MGEREPHTEAEILERLRSLDVRAPAELHRHVHSLLAARSSHAPRHRAAPRPRPRVSGRRTGPLRLGAGIAAALVALVLVAALGSPGGSRALTVSGATALTLRAASMPAPGESRRDRAALTTSVDGVAFPYWDGRFGWRASGARSDRLGGRFVRTVFYVNARAQRVGYAIVAGTPAPAASGGTVLWRAGTAYHLVVRRGLSSVAWLRAGHLCVVAGRGVPSATLLALASWEAHGTLAA